MASDSLHTPQELVVRVGNWSRKIHTRSSLQQLDSRTSCSRSQLSGSMNLFHSTSSTRQYKDNVTQLYSTYQHTHQQSAADHSQRDQPSSTVEFIARCRDLAGSPTVRRVLQDDQAPRARSAIGRPFERRRDPLDDDRQALAARHQAELQGVLLQLADPDLQLPEERHENGASSAVEVVAAAASSNRGRAILPQSKVSLIALLRQRNERLRQQADIQENKSFVNPYLQPARRRVQDDAEMARQTLAAVDEAEGACAFGLVLDAISVGSRRSASAVRANGPRAEGRELPTGHPAWLKDALPAAIARRMANALERNKNVLPHRVARNVDAPTIAPRQRIRVGNREFEYCEALRPMISTSP
jgi:hypothetical protein